MYWKLQGQKIKLSKRLRRIFIMKQLQHGKMRLTLSKNTKKDPTNLWQNRSQIVWEPNLSSMQRIIFD